MFVEEFNNDETGTAIRPVVQ